MPLNDALCFKDIAKERFYNPCFRKSWSEYWLYDLLALWPWTSYLVSLPFSHIQNRKLGLFFFTKLLPQCLTHGYFDGCVTLLLLTNQAYILFWAFSKLWLLTGSKHCLTPSGLTKPVACFSSLLCKQYTSMWLRLWQSEASCQHGLRSC